VTLVKICGLTRHEDVRAAVEAGAWACGFVLTDSPRRVSTLQARELAAEAGTALTVGVFTTEPAETIADAVLAAGLRCVQLSAGADGCTVAEVHAALRRCFEAASHDAVSVAGTFADRAEHVAHVIAARDTPDAFDADLVLFDARLPDAYGGTGQRLDWSHVAAEVRGLPEGIGIVLAGGLAAMNVGAAIRAVRPRAVDVSSGVESAPGVKDPAAIEAFIGAVHAADRPGSAPWRPPHRWSGGASTGPGAGLASVPAEPGPAGSVDTPGARPGSAPAEPDPSSSGRRPPAPADPLPTPDDESET